MKMDNYNGHVMTLANSIIGVGILAMPYCFKQCGIVLSIIMLLISSIISRLACHFLLKSAIIARRKTFEFLAYHIFGAFGKLAIEVGMIGFLLGTCIAFFVVMGDLGPAIVAEITGTNTTNTMRTSILMALALFCVLPLGLLRNVDSLNGVSKATIGFYCCLVLKIIFEAAPHLFSGDWYDNVVIWRTAGILQCLPIFSMALFCQTQLFEIYQALQNATLDKMNSVVRTAVNICTCVYIFVGAFGYIAFSKKSFTGNILLTFSPSLMTDVMKIGFILSLAFSFPLVIFPCRQSLYSLLYKEGYSVHEGMSNYIPEGKFKGLTMLIVFISLIVGIMIPNIELVLGLVGSTIGVMICVLFPVTCFICISPKNTNERILAQIMLMVGIFVMVLGTYKNLYSLESLESNTVTIKSLNNLEQFDLNPAAKVMDNIQLPKNVVEKVATSFKPVIVNNINVVENVKPELSTLKIVEPEIKEIRHEPPQPIEPQEEVNEIKKNDKDVEPEVENVPAPEKVEEKKMSAPSTEAGKLLGKIKTLKNDTKNEEVDIEAIKKEDKEVELQEKEKIKQGDTHQVLIDTIKKQNEVQKEIVEQQKKLIEVIQSQQKEQKDEVNQDKINEEKLKAVKQIESIALKAIEKISGDQNNEKVIADLEKDIKQNIDKKLSEKLEVNVAQQEVLSEKKDKIEESKQRDLNPQVNLKIEERSKIESNNNNEVKDNKNVNLPKEVKHNADKVEDTNQKLQEHPDNVQENHIPLNNEIKKIEPDNQNVPLQVDKVISEKHKENNIKDGVNVVSSSNKNKTPPLLSKLGKADLKSLDKLLPLPLAISGNFSQNKVSSTSDGPKKVVAHAEKNIDEI